MSGDGMDAYPPLGEGAETPAVTHGEGREHRCLDCGKTFDAAGTADLHGMTKGHAITSVAREQVGRCGAREQACYLCGRERVLRENAGGLPVCADDCTPRGEGREQSPLHDRCLVCDRDFPQSYDECPSRNQPWHKRRAEGREQTPHHVLAGLDFDGPCAENCPHPGHRWDGFDDAEDDYNVLPEDEQMGREQTTCPKCGTTACWVTWYAMRSWDIDGWVCREGHAWAQPYKPAMASGHAPLPADNGDSEVSP